MPREVTDVDVLQQYISGVMERADHHGQTVNEVILGLVGAIVWRKDQEPIKVLARQGEMANVLWVRINGERYAFSYDHEAEAIDMRRGSTQGPTVASFDNDTDLASIRHVFEAL